jgi:hypothetical protein
MQINSINSFLQGLSFPNLINNVASSISPSAASTTSLDKTFDIHNMSLDELKEMIHYYHDQGALSDDEAVRLSEERFDLEHLNGYPTDKKMDVAALFQTDIDNIKAQPDSKGVEYLENALEALKRVDARSKAQIPKYV